MEELQCCYEDEAKEGEVTYDSLLKLLEESCDRIQEAQLRWLMSIWSLYIIRLERRQRQKDQDSISVIMLPSRMITFMLM